MVVFATRAIVGAQQAPTPLPAIAALLLGLAAVNFVTNAGRISAALGRLMGPDVTH